MTLYISMDPALFLGALPALGLLFALAEILKLWIVCTHMETAK